jgi:hypothetical protein
MISFAVPEQVAIGEPIANIILRLFYESPHGEAEYETTRPIGTLLLNTIPQPREDHGGGFSETSRDIYKFGFALRTAP